MVEKVLSLLSDSSSALLITSNENRRYVSSFDSSAGAVFVTSEHAYLLVDFRYGEAAKKKCNKDITVIVYSSLYKSINELIKKHNIDTVFIEEQSVTLEKAKSFDELNASVNSDFHLSEKLLKLRTIKTDIEIEKIKTAQKITEKAYLETLNFVKEGVSEKRICSEFIYRLYLYGAEKPAFDPITISGVNTSLPHGVPTDNVIKKGDFFTFDIGAVYDGYHSDMTRTVAVGSATDKMKEIYDIVLTAHKRARDFAKADEKISLVDIRAREYIEQKGYGTCFGHTTGHGVGLEIHESPTVYKTNNNSLKENMIITIEPGIYIENKFGVRIEDTYQITKNGAESLAKIDKDLIIL